MFDQSNACIVSKKLAHKKIPLVYVQGVPVWLFLESVMLKICTLNTFKPVFACKKDLVYLIHLSLLLVLEEDII